MAISWGKAEVNRKTGGDVFPARYFDPGEKPRGYGPMARNLERVMRLRDAYAFPE